MTTITLKGDPLHIVGNLPPVGAQAPEFTVTKSDLSEITLSNYYGKKLILNIFPSLDTPTCAAAMKQFNHLASKNEDLLVLCISADLPFAQKRFCGVEHLNNIQPASIFRHPDFGRMYGVTITDGPLKGLLARAVVLIDEKGKITYTQLVKEITEEPNYDALMEEVNHEIAR